MCEVLGEHVKQGLLQAASRFAVVVCDSQGHRMRHGGDKVRVSSRGPGPLRPSVSDELDGSYTVSYLATVSGTYSLSVSCNSAPIPGSPFTITVEPSVAHAPSCLADGAGLRVAVAGESASFFVRAHDEFGRPKIMGGEVRAVFKCALPRCVTIAATFSVYTLTSRAHSPDVPCLRFPALQSPAPSGLCRLRSACEAAAGRAAPL